MALWERVFWSGTGWVSSATFETPQDPADPFTLNETKPTTTNTGTGLTRNSFGEVVITDKPTAIVNGLSVTQSNQKYENIIVNGQTTISSGVSGTIFRNVEFRGTVSSGDGTQVVNVSNGTNTLLEFCEIRNTTTWSGANAIGNRNFSLYRCYIHHSVDGIRINNPNNRGTAVNVTIEGCWIGNMILRTPDEAFSGTRTDNKTHSDVIQIEDGLNIVIRGNTLFAFHTTDGTSNVDYTVKSGNDWVAATSTTAGASLHPQCNAAIMISPYTSAVISGTIEYNWMDGGEVTVNGLDDMTGNFSYNRLGRGSRTGTALYPSSGGMTRTGNVYEDNGAAVPGGG